ncbi:type II secretion system minor pseudopilin GspK [Thiomicrospira cyclica]|uniref:Type II secretion system protein K n=1 Tax=Thiomicrospira cyclica (strain DSM 14477 / JCM 11371 / ALM1) TaxID=717773 RepID=F6DD30_THICA|nr:type II secretion system minor pseudopilin GspK [Thiomicrospira cyclica]AEG31766.1 general secretion pathway protein K [Thiomicrospira cyclica ALM1]
MRVRNTPQQGFALLSVLVVVALVAVIATGILYQLKLDIKRSSFLQHQSQAIVVSAGIDAWVKKGLAFDASQNETDHLAEAWALPMFPIGFEGGEISGQLFDMQGRFNLNNLATADEVQQRRWRAILERLLGQQDLSSDWVAPLIDWLDADNNPIAGGAEADVYLLKTPPYRAANRMMVLPQEARLLAGMSDEVFGTLLPLLSTLPQITTINVNTAQPQILQALADFMDVTLVDAWVELRLLEPATDTASFRQFIQQQTGRDDSEIQQVLPDSVIGVTTAFFKLQGQIEYGSARLNARALYYRQNQQVNLLQRWIALVDE